MQRHACLLGAASLRGESENPARRFETSSGASKPGHTREFPACPAAIKTGHLHAVRQRTRRKGIPPILFAQIASGFELSHFRHSFRNSSGSLAILLAIHPCGRLTRIKTGRLSDGPRLSPPGDGPVTCRNYSELICRGLMVHANGLLFQASKHDNPSRASSRPHVLSRLKIAPAAWEYLPRSAAPYRGSGVCRPRRTASQYWGCCACSFLVGWRLRSSWNGGMRSVAVTEFRCVTLTVQGGGKRRGSDMWPILLLSDGRIHRKFLLASHQLPKPISWKAIIREI
jgi:hypothetical protein